MRHHALVMDSPIGPLTVAADDTHVTAVHMGTADSLAARMSHVHEWAGPTQLLEDARDQLRAYFGGTLQRFTLPLAPHGTPFQRTVWRELERIPFGATTSYGAIAAAIGAPGSARAVGAANGQNPIAIVIPCHRVIGADGSLTGYGGGMARKQFLLALESAGSRDQLALTLDQLPAG